MLVSKSDAHLAKRQLKYIVKIRELEKDNAWVRDVGPIFATNEKIYGD